MRIRLKELHRKIKTTDTEEYDKMLDDLWKDWDDKKDNEEFNDDGDDLVLKECGIVIDKFEVLCRKAIGLKE